MLAHRLERINKLALRFFLDEFKKSEQAQEYAYSRLPKAVVEKFQIGYAPQYGLIEYLNTFEIDEREAKLAAVVGLDEDHYAYPMFTNRLMFPIRHADRLIGFGGRTLIGAEPKYLNSKMSLLYNKSEVLYGLNDNLLNIDTVGHAFLVEGYFDVLVPYSYGLKNCVAGCGTAFTKEQSKILRRYVNRVYTMYDGDEPGIKAAERAQKVLKKDGLFAGNIALPEGMDPASFFVKHGKKALKKLKGLVVK